MWVQNRLQEAVPSLNKHGGSDKCLLVEVGRSSLTFELALKGCLLICDGDRLHVTEMLKGYVMR